MNPAILSLVLFVCTAAFADDEVPLDQVPDGVKAAIEARWPGSTLHEAERDGDNWEIEFLLPSKELWEAEVTGAGVILRSEREDREDGDDPKAPQK